MYIDRKDHSVDYRFTSQEIKKLIASGKVPEKLSFEANSGPQMFRIPSDTEGKDIQKQLDKLVTELGFLLTRKF